jgi:hypothetical protein
MESKHPRSPSKREKEKKERFKSQPSTGNLLLIAFWNSRGPVLKYCQERGTTICNDHYSEMLTG